MLGRRALLKTTGSFLLAGMGGVGVLSAVERTALAAGDSLAKVRAQGYVLVGFANEIPWGYQTPAGQLTGEAPEVARVIMKDLGVPQLRGVLTEFGSLIPGLLAGRFDLVAAGLFINPARCQQVLFSDPDIRALEALIVKTGNPLKLRDYTSFVTNTNARLGVQPGTVEESYAIKTGVPDSRIVRFPDGPSGLAGLQAGRVDAFSVNSVTARELVQKASGPKVEIAANFAPVVDGKAQYGCGGYAFRKSDTAFRNAFNAKLLPLRQSGKLADIVAPFGFTKSEIATGVTAAQLCAG
jgi:polar amino acid transport system substrate-binding protein